jgi:tRNA threonylcarbamoyladenosine biosynthesis protein TsaB
MLHLAFDTSGTSGFSGSVALLDEGRLLAESPLEAERRSAQSLAPAIDRLLGNQGVKPGQLQLIATTVGPGSFTGLRVGVTTAKTLAYAVSAAVLGVSTLEALAMDAAMQVFAGAPSSRSLQGQEPRREIQAILDAQRHELFVGRFEASPAEFAAREKANPGDHLPTLRRLAPDTIVASDAWLASLTPGILLTGSGLKRLESRLPAGVIALPPERREVRASTVGRLAWRDYLAGRRDDLWKLAPVYLRPSYAEEKAKKGGP